MGLEKFARGVNANFGGMRGGAMLAGAAGNNGRPRNSPAPQARIGGSVITHSGQGRNWAFPAHIEALNNFISESCVTHPTHTHIGEMATMRQSESQSFPEADIATAAMSQWANAMPRRASQLYLEGGPLDAKWERRQTQ